MKHHATILRLASLIGLAAFAVAFVTHEPAPSAELSGADHRRLRTGPASPAERRRFIREATAQLEADPLNWNTWRRLGHTIARAEDPEAAAADWLRDAPPVLVETHRAEAFIRYWMAWSAEERSADETAAARWTTAIEIILDHIAARPADVTYLHHHTLAWSRLKTGDHDGAADAGVAATKLVTARFFAEHLLPQVHGLVAPVKAGKHDLFALTAEQF